MKEYRKEQEKEKGGEVSGEKQAEVKEDIGDGKESNPEGGKDSTLDHGSKQQADESESSKDKA